MSYLSTPMYKLSDLGMQPVLLLSCCTLFCVFNVLMVQAPGQAIALFSQMRNNAFTPPAVNSIAIVKPERAKQVEAMLIQMAQTGQIMGKIGESQLVAILEKVSSQTQKKTTVKFDRRRLDDSDDDDY